MPLDDLCGPLGLERSLDKVQDMCRMLSRAGSGLSHITMTISTQAHSECTVIYTVQDDVKSLACNVAEITSL